MCLAPKAPQTASCAALVQHCQKYKGFSRSMLGEFGESLSSALFLNPVTIAYLLPASSQPKDTTEGGKADSQMRMWKRFYMSSQDPLQAGCHRLFFLSLPSTLRSRDDHQTRHSCWITFLNPGSSQNVRVGGGPPLGLHPSFLLALSTPGGSHMHWATGPILSIFSPCQVLSFGALPVRGREVPCAFVLRRSVAFALLEGLISRLDPYP